jgi:hypothetical protein
MAARRQQQQLNQLNGYLQNVLLMTPPMIAAINVQGLIDYADFLGLTED